MAKMEDPVIPTVTFDSYVRPETIQQKVNARAAVQARYQAIVQQRANVATEDSPAAAPGPVAQQAPPEFVETPPQAPLKAPQAEAPTRRFAWLSGLSPAGLVGAAAVIAVLTFALGVMATLKITGGAQVAGAAGNPQAVTRMQGPDLISPTAIDQQDIVAALAAAPAPATMSEQTLRAQSFVNRNKMRMLREGVLAGVYTVTEARTGGIRRLALTTVNAEMSRASTANLLLEAARRGELKIPISLSTPEGQKDMDTMLFSLIQTSLIQDGTAESLEAAREMSRRAFAASDATTQKVAGRRTYLVRPGDSLAYIAMQFYGRPDAYTRILAANADVMTSPDEIRTGQRLIIPD